MKSPAPGTGIRPAASAGHLQQGLHPVLHEAAQAHPSVLSVAADTRLIQAFLVENRRRRASRLLGAVALAGLVGIALGLPLSTLLPASLGEWSVYVASLPALILCTATATVGIRLRQRRIAARLGVDAATATLFWAALLEAHRRERAFARLHDSEQQRVLQAVLREASGSPVP
jgi:hypothetical protein